MSSKKYRMTVHGVMNWAKHELEHVGYLISVEDSDIQYAYAQSVVNGMLHLRDALLELIHDPAYAHQKEDLQRMHDKIVRTIKHLIKDFDVKLEEIKAFNTRNVLGNLSYLTRHKSKKSRKTRKN